MSDIVSTDEIEAVRRLISEALLASSANSPMPEGKQDELLALACAESCAILDRWVSGDPWKQMRPVGRGPIADAIPDWQRVRPFLERLGATLSRLSERHPGQAGTPEIDDPEAYIDQLIKQAEDTGRRYRRFQRDELFTVATNRIEILRSSVCRASADFVKGSKTRAQRRAVARTALKAVGALLLNATLIIGGVTPQALAHDIPEWGHDAVKVVMVHHAAQSAQPAVRVAPLQLGPRLG